MARLLAVAVLVAACGGVAGGAAPHPPGGHRCSFPAAFQGRQLVLWQPGSARVPTSLVLVFHGLHGGPAEIEGYSGLDRLADDDGALVVYPGALHGEWNQAPAVMGSVPDDIGY